MKSCEVTGCTTPLEEPWHRFCPRHYLPNRTAMDYTDPQRARLNRQTDAAARRRKARAEVSRRRVEQRRRYEALVAKAPSLVKPEKRQEFLAKGWTEERIDEQARAEMRGHLNRHPGFVLNEGEWVRGESYYDLTGPSW